LFISRRKTSAKKEKNVPRAPWPPTHIGGDGGISVPGEDPPLLDGGHNKSEECKREGKYGDKPQLAYSGVSSRGDECLREKFLVGREKEITNSGRGKHSTIGE